MIFDVPVQIGSLAVDSAENGSLNRLGTIGMVVPVFDSTSTSCIENVEKLAYVLSQVTLEKEDSASYFDCDFDADSSSSVCIL